MTCSETTKLHVYPFESKLITDENIRTTDWVISVCLGRAEGAQDGITVLL